VHMELEISSSAEPVQTRSWAARSFRPGRKFIVCVRGRCGEKGSADSERGIIERQIFAAAGLR
jgi:hypothetical protein